MMNDTSNDYGLFISSFSKWSDKLSNIKEIKTVYSLYIVTHGKGKLHSSHISYEICKGDIFMTLPHQGYAIETSENLNCIGISFRGTRGVELAKGLLDNVRTPVFNGYEKLIGLWVETLNKSTQNENALLAEGLLLYTLGSIPGKGILKGVYKKRGTIMIQSYIHNNFSDPDLTLDTLSKVFGYNKKYLSDLFKRKFDVTFTEFLRNVRLEAACNLMQLGNTSVKRISTICGFTDPLYFSKLFKAKYGMSPREYISKMD